MSQSEDNMERNWYYAYGTEPRGPVSDDEFRTLLADGTVTADTLVWHDGMAAWRLCGDMLEGEDIARSFCCRCRRACDTEDMIDYEGMWICAACKPIFFQEITEGARSVRGTGGYGDLAPYCQTNGPAIAGMVLGIISLPALCIWLLGLPCALIGIILSVIGKKRSRETGTGGGMATAGLVLSLVTIGLFGLLLLLAVFSAIA